MKKISTAELKKAILAVEAERLKHPAAFRPDRAQRATLQKSRQASDKIVSGFLKEAGLDFKKLQALQEQRGAELERMIAKHKTDALRLASRQKNTLFSSIAARSKALGDLATRSGFFPYPSFTLDTPFFIGSMSGIDISDSVAVPFGSWAKFKFSTSQSGTQKVAFYFYWTNPFQEYAVINAATDMEAAGHLKAHGPWAFFGMNFSSVHATALFSLYGSAGPVAVTAHASAWLGGCGAVGEVIGDDTEGTSILSGVSLNTTMFPVAPGDVVVFEVALALDYENDSGDIEADFETGDFQIACPVVVFSLLNSPLPGGSGGVMA
jgi:hypothetical protein